MSDIKKPAEGDDIELLPLDQPDPNEVEGAERFSFLINTETNTTGGVINEIIGQTEKNTPSPSANPNSNNVNFDFVIPKEQKKT